MINPAVWDILTTVFLQQSQSMSRIVRVRWGTLKSDVTQREGFYENKKKIKNNKKTTVRILNVLGYAPKKAGET